MSMLSIQSQVPSGHVGNAAAVFPLQRLGFEVWPVPTVLFSNHPGHGGWRGPVLAAADIADILQGLRERGCFAQCQAVLTGYLGSVETGATVIETWRQVREANPEALICCDPVIGDHAEGVYVTPELLDFYRHEALSLADVVFPNAFELEVLTGQPVHEIDAAVDAARHLIAQDPARPPARGPKIVLVTSVPVRNNNQDAIATLAVTSDAAWMVQTPRHALSAKGSGDFLAAVWLGHYLQNKDIVFALGAAVSSTYALIEATGQADELAIITAQDKWLNKTVPFVPKTLT